MRLTYFSPKVEKRDSRIDGRGLFACEALAPGEVAVVKGGYVMTTEERDSVERQLGPAEIQIGEGLFIGPTKVAEREGAMMHLNHSCDPNLGIRGEITFVALRAIEAGEELTMDYAMMDDEEGIEMDCSCGSENCRGTVTGQDWLRPELQERYKGYFSRYLEEKIACLEG